MLETILIILFVLVCVLLIGVILIQKPRGGGLSGAFGGAGGSAQSAFGGKTGDVLTWFTVILFAGFLLLAIFLTLEGKPSAGEAATTAAPIDAGAGGAMGESPLDDPLGTPQSPMAMPPPPPGAAPTVPGRSPALPTQERPERVGEGGAAAEGISAAPVESPREEATPVEAPREEAAPAEPPRQDPAPPQPTGDAAAPPAVTPAPVPAEGAAGAPAEAGR